MAQKTDLNVAPYYDDFESSDNFVRTLFRPGFAIQARELTQLQSAFTKSNRKSRKSYIQRRCSDYSWRCNI